MTRDDLTAERLRECLNYDPATGIFTRKVRTAQCHQVGDRADFLVTAGHLKGYHRIALLAHRYLAHRLAWLYMHGKWPDQEIDHIDGDRSNNRIANLRDVSRQINGENHRKPTRRNTSGFLGVVLHKASGKWVARVTVRHKSIYVGIYDDPESANAAYLDAERKLHEGCTI